MRSGRALPQRGGPDLAIASLLSLGSFLLYLRTLAPTVLAADSGEFQFASYVLGLVHPTGYPLYLLLAKLFTYLPVGDVAYRVNLMSAFWAATTVGLVYYCALHLLRATSAGDLFLLPSPTEKAVLSPLPSQRERVRVKTPRSIFRAELLRLERLPATVAAAAFAVSETFWSQAVIAEVYTLNTFFVALTLLLLVRWRSAPARRQGRLYPLAIAFIFGLSLAHHRSMLLLIPAYAIYLWSTRSPARPEDELDSAPYPQAPSPTDEEKGLGRRSFEVRVASSLSRPFTEGWERVWVRAAKLVAKSVRYVLHRKKPTTYDGGTPAAVLFPLPSQRERVRVRVPGLSLRALASCFLAFSLPLLLYLYVPLRAPESTYLKLELGQGQTLDLYNNDLTGFIDMVSGRVFGSKLEAGTEATLEARGRYYLGLAGRQFGFAGLALGALGAVYALWRRRDVFALLFCMYVATVAFGLVYRIGDIFVFFIPAHMILALAIGFGASAITAFLSAALARASRGPALFLLRAGLFSASFLVSGVFIAQIVLANYGRIDMSRAYEIRERWEQIVATVPEQGAILISDDRDDMVPLWYMQQVESKRTDLIGLFPGIVTSPDYANVVRVIESVRQTNRPVYLVKPIAGLDVRYEVRAAGSLYRVAGEPSGFTARRSVQADFGGLLRLLDYDWRPPSAPSQKLPIVSGGENLALTIRWKTLAPLGKDYRTFVHLIDQQGRAVTQSDVTPGALAYPSSRWIEGETLFDTHPLVLPRDLAPGFYEMRAGLYDAQWMTNLATGRGEGSVIIGRVFVRRGQAAPPPGRPAQAVFGQAIQLLGYDLEGGVATAGKDSFALPAGKPLKLTLHWRTAAEVPLDYTVFVHVVDSQGRLVAQADGMPQGGKAPTSEWPAGEVLLDGRSIELHGGLANGPYTVLVGLYDGRSGQRLPLETGTDTLPLLRFELTR